MTGRKDYQLFASLLAWALLPSVYMLIRMHIVAVNGVDINILGQLEWFDLIDEVLVTAMTVPLYSLLRPKTEGSGAAANTLALLLSFAVYLLFTAAAVTHITGIAAYMNAAGAERYLSMQAVSMPVGYLAAFGVLLLTVNGDGRAVRCLTLIRLGALIVFDCVLISGYGDVGAAYSELAANAAAAIAALTLCGKRGYLARPGKADRAFLVSWGKRGVFAGAQIFLDNFIYAVMICRMVNAVNESGNYWIANNFIWGWLLVPVSAMAEVIRKNGLEKLELRNTWRFGFLAAGLWALTVPLWPWFIRSAMAAEDADAILRILRPSVLFYLAYIPSAWIDSWFISKGKTWCLTVISAAVNLVYYGILYILFQRGVFAPSMSFIIRMFGWGMVFHLLLSVLLYAAVRRGSGRRGPRTAG